MLHSHWFQPTPVQNQPIPVHSHIVDRVDENRQPPQKQVSETDLYLLGAIEKLVWRADLFEKRLRKLEESVHLLVAGVDKKDGAHYGSCCYTISSSTLLSTFTLIIINMLRCCLWLMSVASSTGQLLPVFRQKDASSSESNRCLVMKMAVSN